MNLNAPEIMLSSLIFESTIRNVIGLHTKNCLLFSLKIYFVLNSPKTQLHSIVVDD